MPRTYFQHLLAFGLPVLLLQAGGLIALHGRRVVRIWRALAVPVIAVAAWLTVADAVAIRRGLWQFDPRVLAGVNVGPVPLEEVLFFLLANALVAQGLALLWGPNLPGRPR